MKTRSGRCTEHRHTKIIRFSPWCEVSNAPSASNPVRTSPLPLCSTGWFAETPSTNWQQEVYNSGWATFWMLKGRHPHQNHLPRDGWVWMGKNMKSFGITTEEGAHIYSKLADVTLLCPLLSPSSNSRCVVTEWIFVRTFPVNSTNIRWIQVFLIWGWTVPLKYFTCTESAWGRFFILNGLIPQSCLLENSARKGSQHNVS